jgi:phage gp46-like protein
VADIATTWRASRGDWALAQRDLAGGDDVVTAVLLSIFTDREADPDDAIPDGSGDPRGWWGDLGRPLLGSRLWLIERAKKTQQTLALAKGYIEECLQWLVDDGVAESIEVLVEWTRGGTLGAQVTVFRTGARPPVAISSPDLATASQVESWGWNEAGGTGQWVPVDVGPIPTFISYRITTAGARRATFATDPRIAT